MYDTGCIQYCFILDRCSASFTLKNQKNALSAFIPSVDISETAQETSFLSGARTGSSALRRGSYATESQIARTARMRKTAAPAPHRPLPTPTGIPLGKWLPKILTFGRLLHILVTHPSSTFLPLMAAAWSTCGVLDERGEGNKN